MIMLRIVTCGAGDSFEIVETYLNWELAVRTAIQKAVNVHSDEQPRVDVDSVLQQIRVFLSQIIRQKQEEQARFRQNTGQFAVPVSSYAQPINPLRDQITSSLSQIIVGLTADILEYGTRESYLLSPNNAIFDIGIDNGTRFAVIQNHLV